MMTSPLGSGSHGIIEILGDQRTVSKRFRSVDSDTAIALARREYEHLKRFSLVLEQEPFLGCPEPVGPPPERGEVLMSYCPGQRLDILLASSGQNIRADFEHILDQILIGVTRYTVEFNEAYDLATHNLLYDPDSRILYFLDFTRPGIFESTNSRQPPVEACLGGLIGFGLYGTVRPRTWTNSTCWRVNQQFILAVLRKFAAHTDLTWSAVDDVSDVAYGWAGKRGGFRRRMWYSTVGELLFKRRKSALFSALHRGKNYDHWRIA